jgi:hypothetical protein
VLAFDGPARLLYAAAACLSLLFLPTGVMNRRAMELEATDISKEDHGMTDTAAEAVTTTEAAHPGQNAPKKSKANKDTSSSDGAPNANRGANKAKPKKKTNAAAQKPTARKQPKAKKAAKPAAETREGSKKGIILDLLRRPKGTTLGEIMKATKWQAHSVRGFIAGSLKRAGVLIDSAKSEAGERTYRIAK